MLRISSIISITTFPTIWLDFQQRGFISFAMEFTSLKFQNFFRNVIFHIMLSSAIKSHAFVPYKKAFLQDVKFWKEEGALFLLKVIFTKMCFAKFTLEISQDLLQTMLNFILNSFSFRTLSQISISWFP